MNRLVDSRQSAARETALIERERELIRELVDLEAQYDANALAMQKLTDAGEDRAKLTSQHAIMMAGAYEVESDAMKVLRESGELMQAEIEERSRLIDENSAKIEESAQAHTDFANTAITSFATLDEAYDSLSETTQSALDGILGAYETMTSSLSDLSKKIVLDSETTWAKIQENQADTITKVTKFAELYAQAITLGVSESYLNAIGATGPEATPLLEGLLDAGIDVVLQSQSEWEAAYSGIADTAVNAFQLDESAASAIKDFVVGSSGIHGSLLSAVESVDWGEIGKYVPGALAGGIEDDTHLVEDASGKMGEAAINAYKRSVEQNSPPKAFVNLGGDIPTALAMGIEQKSGVATDAFQKWYSEMDSTANTQNPQLIAKVAAYFAELPPKITVGLNRAHDAVKQWYAALIATANTETPKFVQSIIDGILPLIPEMNSLGAQSVDSFISGMESRKNALANAVRDVFGEVPRAGRDVLDMHSPSRLTYGMGDDSVQGYINAWLDRAGDIADAVSGALGFGSVYKPEFAVTTPGNRQLAYASPAPAAAAPVGNTYNLHMQTAPMTPYEAMTAAKATFDWNRWG